MMFVDDLFEDDPASLEFIKLVQESVQQQDDIRVIQNMLYNMRLEREQNQA
jgi:predicted ATPase